MLTIISKSTPRVDFNAKNRMLIIKGQSYPENSFKFYDPISQWLDMLFTTVEDDDGLIKLEISLPYINTSSTKCILMLLEKFEVAEKNGRNMDVTWYYDKENENELECAQDFKEFVELEFNLIAV
ncbi:MAG: DUF1987 domain-containing protein [Desulfobacteraceae bacterium]|nr:DUF1987 domain-containing protein [Desulfobacteraceae bacterium]